MSDKYNLFFKLGMGILLFLCAGCSTLQFKSKPYNFKVKQNKLQKYKHMSGDNKLGKPWLLLKIFIMMKIKDIFNMMIKI